MSRRRHHLLIVALVLLARSAWALTPNAYQTFWINTYCSPTATCSDYWPMDDAAGPTVDEKCNLPCGLGSGFDMTAVNTPTFNQSGPNSVRGNSILFDAGSTEYAEVNANATGSGVGDVGDHFSTGCWGKINTAATRTMISANTRSATNIPTNDRVWRIATTTIMGFELDQADPNDNSAYALAVGASTITTNTWYFYVGTWNHSTTTATVYLNGVADGNNGGTTTGAASNGVEYYDIATRTADTPDWEQGYLSDCFIVKKLLTPSEITIIYTEGGSAPIDDWPYNVKAPGLPRYMTRNDYFTRAAELGYNTGLFSGRVMRPQTLNPGYLTFVAMPRGDVR